MTPEQEKRFRYLARITSTPGWGDDAAEVITTAQWDMAKKVVEFIAGIAPDAPHAFVSACEDGSIHLEWSNAENSVVAELAEDDIYWVVRAMRGVAWEKIEIVELARAVRDTFTYQHWCAKLRIAEASGDTSAVKEITEALILGNAVRDTFTLAPYQHWCAEHNEYAPCSECDEP